MSRIAPNDNYFECPLSKQIFFDPVTLEDGFTYERNAIENWLKTNATSPMTRQTIINKNVSTNVLIKQMVEKYLLDNPNLKNGQHPPYVKMHSFKWCEFKEIKDENKWKEYLDTCENLECDTNKKWRPIHFVCHSGTFDNIKYLVDKGVNLECEESEKWRPIHFVCRYGTFESIKYLVDKGVNLECETSKKWRPIHIVCCYATFGSIKYLVDKGVNLECETSKKWRPIHLVCRNRQEEIILFLFPKCSLTKTCIPNNIDINFMQRFTQLFTNIEHTIFDLLKLNPLIKDADKFIETLHTYEKLK